MNWHSLEALICEHTDVRLGTIELEYLEQAYLEIEEMWRQRRDALEEIDVIILGEAPLFGSEKKYIYSPNGKPSAFLRTSDFPNADETDLSGGKKSLWKLLETNKMIVVDLFPYALNSISTPSLVYKTLQKSKYKSFYHKIFKEFTAVKLQEIKRNNPNVSVLVRYKRLIVNIAPLLEEMGFVEGQRQGGYVGIYSSNMWVEKEVFHSFCK